MDFTPFQAPASDHDPFHTGLSAEKGVTPKNFVEGVNAYFTHVFEVLKGDVAHAVEIVDDDARKALLHLAEHVTALEQKMENLLTIVTAFHVNAAPIEGQPAIAAGEDPHGSMPPPNQSAGASSALQAALSKAAGQ